MTRRSRKACAFIEACKFGCGALASARYRQHGNVHHSGFECRFLVLRQQRFDDDQAGLCRSCASHVTEDRDDLIVIPVV